MPKSGGGGGGHKPTCGPPTFESGGGVGARAPLPPFSYALDNQYLIVQHDPESFNILVKTEKNIWKEKISSITSLTN